MSALTEAVKSKDVKAVKALLEGGASPNDGSIPPLHIALGLKSKTLIKVLLAAGADVHGFHAGRNAIQRLAEEVRDPKIGAMMLEAGADLNAPNQVEYEGFAPLHYATKVRKLDFAQWLLDSGADVDPKCSEESETPLMALLRSNSGEMSATEIANARWLIERGADVTTMNDFGCGTLHHCSENGPLDLLNELVERGATIVLNQAGASPLRYTMRTHGRNRAMWDRLLELGCDLNEVANGETVVMSAQSSANPTAVAYCVKKGADLSILDDTGRTVVDRANGLASALKALGVAVKK